MKALVLRNVLLLAVGLLGLSGCRAGPYGSGLSGAQVVVQNPVFIPARDPHCVWEATVDVVDDYFRIANEDPVRVVGNSLTEGRLETFYEVGATIFEPWRRDSANEYERLESTLQSIRRRSIVRVIPAQGGFWIDVAVFKELEDLPRPEQATAGAATFRYDSGLTRVVNPGVLDNVPQGWIAQGRDVALEQRMLSHLQARLQPPGAILLPTAPTAAPLAY